MAAHLVQESDQGMWYNSKFSQGSPISKVGQGNLEIPGSLNSQGSLEIPGRLNCQGCLEIPGSLISRGNFIAWKIEVD